MKSLGLRTAVYIVDNLKEAKDWYSKAFETQPYFDEPFYVGFNIQGYELGLLPEEKSTTKGENAFSYWGVEDIQKAYKSLLGLGATTFEEPNNVGGELMVAAVKDPWQNIIGLIYNPYFKLP
ncbi:MAG: VOC family protein [Flavobacteriaceae bacterium]|jgi:predicted enzyme related to lactoylglutathione lyase